MIGKNLPRIHADGRGSGRQLANGEIAVIAEVERHRRDRKSKGFIADECWLRRREKGLAGLDGGNSLAVAYNVAEPRRQFQDDASAASLQI